MSPVFAVMLTAVACVLASSAGATDGLSPTAPAPKPAPVKVAPPGKAVASAPAQLTRAVDRLELDSTAITGNRELPKVMSIVPWKAAEPPTGPDRPMGSLVEELLAPLDRDEFRREITYFSDLSSHSSDRPTPGAVKP
jgi:hypothetical protein